MQPVCESPGIPQYLTCMWPRIETYQYTFTGTPDLRNSMISHIALKLRLSLFSSTSQCYFTQCRQIALTEEVVEGRSNAFGRINVAVSHTLAQRIRRNINQLYFIGLIENP